jgi:hypothetical protein
VVSLLQAFARWYYARSLPKRLEAGDLCSIVSGNQFSVAKVLALSRDVVHVRTYKENFTERPARIDIASLSMGSIDDPDGFGVGHLPLSRGSFGSWLPRRAGHDPVIDDELIWVHEWEKSRGGVWM